MTHTIIQCNPLHMIVALTYLSVWPHRSRGTHQKEKRQSHSLSGTEIDWLIDWFNFNYARIKVEAQMPVGQPVLETVTNTYTHTHTYIYMIMGEKKIHWQLWIIQKSNKSIHNNTGRLYMYACIHIRNQESERENSLLKAKLSTVKPGHHVDGWRLHAGLCIRPKVPLE